jgi:uncharacterized coiled-coil protein SlyX
MNQEELKKAIDELEERIEIQIITMQVINGTLNDLYRRVQSLKEDSV